MKILVTGRDGQVGWELARVLPQIGEVVALGRNELDLGDPGQIVKVVREVKPDVIVNSAAYTAVDKAESEPEQAYLVNAAAPGFLAAEAKALGALLIHYSTDYVFDGAKQGPYVETDVPRPVSVYGDSKLAGEQAVQAVGGRHVILRTSWVYAARGKNFLLTMLKLGMEKPQLRVVDDQRGAPTWARSIAEATATIIRDGDPPSGLYHFTAAGQTTWCGFAREILRLAEIATPVKGITTAEYPTPAKRPANSVLDTQKLRQAFGIRIAPWGESLAACLQSR
jgi:dTDP-4-dehydrorhamnose reductase